MKIDTWKHEVTFSDDVFAVIDVILALSSLENMFVVREKYYSVVLPRPFLDFLAVTVIKERKKRSEDEKLIHKVVLSPRKQRYKVN